MCDCCDGSDEYLNTELKCKNICEELYHDYLLKKIEEEEIYRESNEMKEEYYIKGKEKYETLSEEVGNMKSEVEIKQKELKELKELKEKEEKIEKEVYLYFIKYNFKIRKKKEE